MTEESELRCSIAGNRAAFPIGIAAAVTNAVNSDGFLGASIHQWKCQGISGQQQVEVVNGAEIKYWSVTVELIYRASGWNLLLPNVGFNFIEHGKKKRCFVLDESNEKIPSANALPLNDSGGIREVLPNDPITILNRRVHPEIAFTPYFGTPPF